MLSNHVGNGFLILENLFDLLEKKHESDNKTWVSWIVTWEKNTHTINVWENVPYIFLVPYKRGNISFLGDFYLDFGIFGGLFGVIYFRNKSCLLLFQFLKVSEHSRKTYITYFSDFFQAFLKEKLAF